MLQEVPREVAVGVIAGGILSALGFTWTWYRNGGDAMLGVEGTLVVLLGSALVGHLAADVVRVARGRRANRAADLDPRRSEIVRIIKKEFQGPYYRLVMRRMRAVMRPHFSRGGSDVDYAGIGGLMDSHLAAGYQAFAEAWDRSKAYPRFEELTKDLPPALSKADLEAIVDAYMDSVNDYLLLREKMDAMVEGKAAIARAHGHVAVAEGAVSDWKAFKPELVAFDEGLRRLNKELRSYGVRVSFGGRHDLVRAVCDEYA